MHRTLQRLAASVAMVAAVGLAGGVAEAAPTNETGSGVRPAVCGYWEESGLSYYNHCGSTWVVIRIERAPDADIDRCVGPGNTLLGTARPPVYWAWYTGRLC